jgi:hypothetical protein
VVIYGGGAAGVVLFLLSFFGFLEGRTANGIQTAVLLAVVFFKLFN